MPVIATLTLLSMRGCSPVADRVGLTEALLQVASDLTILGRRFALVGGLAVSARAEIRFTRDVDLAVAVVDRAGRRDATCCASRRAR